ncbi:MAG: DUF736 domain-containing protein [Hyphomicrobium sp.]
MIIGTFTYDEKTGTYTGHVVTLSFERQGVALIPNATRSDKEPDYRVIVEASGAELGAAWSRTSERGQDYLSVLLDGPLLPKPLNAALFPGDEGAEASLVWSRPRRKPKPPPDRSGSRQASIRKDGGFVVFKRGERGRDRPAPGCWKSGSRVCGMRGSDI